MGRSHALSGLAAGLLVGALAPTPAIGLVCGGVGMLTSWGPDLDHPAGRPARALGPVTWLLCRTIRAVSRAVGLPAHRGASHTVLAALTVGVLGGFLAAVWLPVALAVCIGSAGCAGYLAALAGDWVTRSSLPHLLWPVRAVTPGPPKWMRLSTGKGMERYAVVPLLLVACVLSAGLTLGVWR